MTTTLCSSSLYRDLYFTLGTPLTSLSRSKIDSMWSLFTPQSGDTHNSEFYSKLSKRIEEAHFLKEISFSEHSNFIIKGIASYCLSEKTKECVEIYSQSPSELNLEIAQKMYSLAQDLKRHESHRKTVWNLLPKVHQISLHQFSSIWSEDLNVLDQPLYYQWLGDGRIERTRQNNETITDFGDGKLFRVQPLLFRQETQSHFPLTQHPNFNIAKASHQDKPLSSFYFITSTKTLNRTAIGRLGEIFEVDALEEKIKNEAEKSTLYINQLFNVFSCYRSALCSVLELPVHMPLAIGRQGEWSIWKNEKKQRLNNELLSPTHAKDLHLLLRVERLLRVNVFHHPSCNPHPSFATYQDRLFVDEIFSLPTSLNADIEKRHQYLLKHFKFDPLAQEQWNVLEKATRKEEKKIEVFLSQLQILIDQNRLSEQDLFNLDPQALWLVSFRHLLDEEMLLKSPVITASMISDTIQKMLFLLFPVGPSLPYTYEQTLHNKGELLTDKLLQAKKELKNLLLLVAIQEFKKKESIEACFQNFAQFIRGKCQEAVEELQAELSTQWPLKESVEEHLMHFFGYELLEELENQQACEPAIKVQDQLLLLRKAAEGPQADLEKINMKLQSTLHDAMVTKYSEAFFEDIQVHLKHHPFKY